MGSTKAGQTARSYSIHHSRPTQTRRHQHASGQATRLRKRTASIEPTQDPYDHLDKYSETYNDADAEHNDALLQTQDDTEMQTLQAMLLTMTPHIIAKFNKLAKRITHSDQIPNLQN
jgi:hypothetical protein